MVRLYVAEMCDVQKEIGPNALTRTACDLDVKVMPTISKAHHSRKSSLALVMPVSCIARMNCKLALDAASPRRYKATR